MTPSRRIKAHAPDTNQLHLIGKWPWNEHLPHFLACNVFGRLAVSWTGKIKSRELRKEMFVWTWSFPLFILTWAMQQLCFPAVIAKAKLWRYSIPGVLKGWTPLLGCFDVKMDLEIQLNLYGSEVQHLEQQGQLSGMKLISSWRAGLVLVLRTSPGAAEGLRVGWYFSLPVLQPTLGKGPCCLHYLPGQETVLGLTLYTCGDVAEFRITTTEKEELY